MGTSGTSAVFLQRTNQITHFFSFNLELNTLVTESDVITGTRGRFHSKWHLSGQEPGYYLVLVRTLVSLCLQD